MPTRGNVPEDRHPRGGEAGVAALPEGRVRREREQQRDVDAQPAQRAHRRLGVGHRDVHVQRERRLAPRQLAHRVVDRLVAGARARPRRRSTARTGACRRPRRAGRAARGRRRARRAGAASSSAAPSGGRVRAAGQLERGAVRLGRGMVGDDARQRGQHVVDPRGERPVVRVEEHDLLLQPDRPRRGVRVRAPRGPLRQPPHGITHVSLAPPFWDELTTSAPSSSATGSSRPAGPRRRRGRP